MGELAIQHETYHREKITTTLKRRRQRPDFREPWEVHGPHANMNYQLYVGYAVSLDDPNESVCVSVWPGHGVYEIDDPADWYKTEPERRILA